MQQPVRATGASVGTAEGWIHKGKSVPADALFTAAKTSKELREAMILALAGDSYADIIKARGGREGEALRREVALARGEAVLGRQV